MQQKRQYSRGLAARLSRSTGMCESAVYRCLRDSRLPKNPTLASIWTRVISEAEGAEADRAG